MATATLRPSLPFHIATQSSSPGYLGILSARLHYIVFARLWTASSRHHELKPIRVDILGLPTLTTWNKPFPLFQLTVHHQVYHNHHHHYSLRDPQPQSSTINNFSVPSFAHSSSSVRYPPAQPWEIAYLWKATWLTRRLYALFIQCSCYWIPHTF